MNALPATPGTYLLILELARQRRFRVGELGEHDFQPGWYLYVGSALGAGGLRARVGRHLRGGVRQHWHIDALRAVADPRELWYSESRERHETLWSQRLRTADLRQVVAGFGASDSAAATHLFYSPTRPAWRALSAHLAHAPPICRLCIGDPNVQREICSGSS